MNSTPLVTVGIPAYNAERFIGLAIKSVLAQTFTDFELIITDDGSTDDTVAIAHSFSDPRITVIADGENHGISYRLNQQINLARGKYFVRMDADDIMMPDRIEKQVRYLEAHPNVAIVSGQAIIIDEQNRIIGMRCEYNIPRRFGMDDWISGRTLIHPSVAGKIETFRHYHYRDKYRGVEDIDFWARSCSSEILTILPFPVLYYRDPLKFKLKTYKFRRHQSERLYCELARSGIISYQLSKKLIFKSIIKSIIATAISSLHLDFIMISKRNQELENNTEYENLLSRLT